MTDHPTTDLSTLLNAMSEELLGIEQSQKRVGIAQPMVTITTARASEILQAARRAELAERFLREHVNASKDELDALRKEFGIDVD